MNVMTSIAGYVALAFIAALGASVIGLIWKDRIRLDRLISEPNGDASMSRFQLLIFTFVISASLFLVIAAHKDYPAFPEDIPNGVLLLLGISSSSYLVSKGIQFSTREGVEDRPPLVMVSPASARTSVGGPRITFNATVERSSNEAVTWVLDPPAYGSVDQRGVYTPPGTPPDGVSLPIQVIVRATSDADGAASAFGTVTLS